MLAPKGMVPWRIPVLPLCCVPARFRHAIEDLLGAGHGLAVVALKLSHEADADAGDGGLDRHARIHEREDAAADGSHRGGAVRLTHFAADADGVWEVFRRRDDRCDETLGECAVADFAVVHAAHAAGFDNEPRILSPEDVRIQAVWNFSFKTVDIISPV